MTFRDTSKLSLELSSILEAINSLPKVNCSRCGTVYRGKEENFICTDCKEKEQNKFEEIMKKNHQIKRLFQLSNIPKRYKNAIFEAKTSIQNQVRDYFLNNFSKKENLTESTDILLFGAIEQVKLTSVVLLLGEFEGLNL